MEATLSIQIRLKTLMDPSRGNCIEIFTFSWRQVLDTIKYLWIQAETDSLGHGAPDRASAVALGHWKDSVVASADALLHWNQAMTPSAAYFGQIASSPRRLFPHR